MSATPFTNDDFRKFLETPRIHRGGETPARNQKSSIHFGGASRVKEPPPPKEKSSKPKRAYHKPEPKEDDPLKELKDKYRDRADERRRREENPNYERVEDSVDTSGMSVEKTKFLGGDMEHTYLVKGLDYVLMEKTRREAEDSESKKRIAQKDSAAAAASTDIDIAPRSLLAKNVYDIAVRRPKLGFQATSAARDLFLPKRMAFLYELESSANKNAYDSENRGNSDALDPESDFSDASYLPPIPSLFGYDVPNTVYRSKAECPAVSDHKFGGEESLAVLAKISKIFNYSKATSANGSGNPPSTLERKSGEDSGKGTSVASMKETKKANTTDNDGTLSNSSDRTNNSNKNSNRADDDDDDDDMDIFEDAGRDYAASIQSEKAKALAEELKAGLGG
eukprot:CAMPEP_0175076884 /NCGR_PEP_ID=MMETSP0052_2-20121109/23023_1 /TAXON_ID=51329 ORGANISM="Polytomella parva, Strain SAG 63-3" /NCGR_SAMPLE_ID=MMETSP0052_2 /ASSEMBLY_ACC=CAM_ASM_000194 /LENGTH=393 /DNA_ID=CAMNT_0016346169 /DNA_START=44 /DNA_END=1222 /DNA_ORIENTATION=+